MNEKVNNNGYNIIAPNQFNEPAIDDLLKTSNVENVQNALRLAKKWVAGEEQFTFTTSGSTGEPKQIILPRNLMELSARNTIQALGLLPGDKALLCMDAGFIGGAMMVIRAIVGEMHLIITQPSRNPLFEGLPLFDFAAMVPLQIKRIISGNDQVALSLLNCSKVLILGGGPVDIELEEAVEELNCKVFATYGMTETVSHIALKQLNGVGKSNYFMAVGDAKFELSGEDTLIVNGSITNHLPLKTNDVVKLIDEHQFEWLGRADFIVNSGGIKVNPFELEAQMKEAIFKLFGPIEFLIIGVPDKVYGEAVALVIEYNGTLTDHLERLKLTTSGIQSYKFPKRLVALKKFPETASGKTDRRAIKTYLKDKNE